MPKTHVITLRVDEALARRIIRAAKKNRMSMNGWLYNLIERHFEEVER